MPNQGLLIGGAFAEALNNALKSYQSEKRYQDERAEKKKDTELNRDVELYKSLTDDQKLGSKAGRDLFKKISASGLLQEAPAGLISSSEPSTSNATNSTQGAARTLDSGSNMAPPKIQSATQAAESSDPFALDKGYKSKEQRAIEKELELYRRKKEIDRRLELAEKGTPQAKFDKLPAEAKKLVSMAAEGVNAMDLYKAAFDSGERERYINTSTPLVGSFVKGTDIDRARDQAAEYFGRLQSGGAINKDEESRFVRMLPTKTDSPEQAQAKIEQAYRAFFNKMKTFGVDDPTSIGLDRPGVEKQLEGIRGRQASVSDEAPLFSLGNDASKRPRPVNAVMPSEALAVLPAGAYSKAAGGVAGLLKSAGPEVIKQVGRVSPGLLKALGYGGAGALGAAVSRGLLK